MIIDMHAHTSNHPLWGLHTEDATIRKIEAEARKYSVDKVILMATCFPLKKNPGLSNQMLLERIRGNKLFSMFATFNAEECLLKAHRELEPLLYSGAAVGIKMYPGYQNFDPSDQRMAPFYQLAAKYRVPVMFHCGELHPCCSRDENGNRRMPCHREVCPLESRQHLSHPSRLERAVAAFPEVNFVASHLGNPHFEDLRQLMARYPNLYTDISGQFLSCGPEDNDQYKRLIQGEIMKFLALRRGEDRVLFGTDFPIQSYADSVALIEGLEINLKVKNKIERTNALKLLGGV